MRIGLARLLLSSPDVLLLDEPTNHLDASARSWLAGYVRDYAGTVVTVSHDRAFIDVAAESIAEVDRGRLELFKSVTYEKYLEQRKSRREQAAAAVEAGEREAARLKDFINRMGAKASKARQAKDRQGKLARIEQAIAAAKSTGALTAESRAPKLTLAPPPACGAEVVALEDANLRHKGGDQASNGICAISALISISAMISALISISTVISANSQDILRGVDLTIGRDMRLVLRGPNGTIYSALFRDEDCSVRPFSCGTFLIRHTFLIWQVRASRRCCAPSLTAKRWRAASEGLTSARRSVSSRRWALTLRYINPIHSVPIRYVNPTHSVPIRYVNPTHSVPNFISSLNMAPCHQDLAQDLPLDAIAYEHVAAAAPAASDERCRTVLGALGERLLIV